MHYGYLFMFLRQGLYACTEHCALGMELDDSQLAPYMQ